MRSKKNRGSKKPIDVVDRAIAPAWVQRPASFVPETAMTLRFTSTTATTAIGITAQMLLNSVLRATSSTALVQEFHYVKIRRVRLILQPRVGAGGYTIDSAIGQVKWQGAGQENGLVKACTAVGVAPGVIDCKPPVRIPFLSQWNINTAGQLFIVNATSFIMLEVDVSFRTELAVNAAAMNTGTALATGAVYARGLDGLAISSTVLLPTSLDGTAV